MVREHLENLGVPIITYSLGVHLTVFSVCAYYLVHNMWHSRGRRNLEFLLLSILLLTGATINLAGNVVLSEEAWVDDRGVDGGPIAWLTTACVGPNCALGNYGYIISNFFADGLLVSVLAPSRNLC